MTTPDADVFADNPGGNTPITAAKLNTLIGVANAALQDQLVATVTKTSAYTAAYRDLVMVDATAGAVTITAPAAAAGRFFGVKKIDASSNTVTVTAASTDTIGAQGGTTLILRTQDETRLFDGQAGNWAAETGMNALPALDARYVMPFNVKGLQNFYAALGQRITKPVDIVTIGGSGTAGQNASSLTTSYVGRLTKQLQASYNPAGIPGGFYWPAYTLSSIPSVWSCSGTVTANGFGLSLNSLNLTAGATMSGTFTNSTGFTVLYANGASIGTFTVTIDGGTPVTITPATSGAQYTGAYTTSVLGVGQHTILISAVGATTINGVYVHNGDSAVGVRVWNSGCASQTSANFLASDTLQERIGQIAPSLITIMLGLNDLQSNVAPATFASNLTSLIGRFRTSISGASKPPASFLLIGTYNRLDVTSPTYPWPQYLAAMQSVAAAASDVGYLDASGVPFAFVTNDSTGDPYDLLASDGAHLNDNGYLAQADLIGRRALGVGTASALTASPSLSPGLDPDKVFGLVARYSAETLATAGGADGSAVSSWSPATGAVEAAPLAQATTAQQPVLHLNRVGGRPTVTFTATNSSTLSTGSWGTSKPLPNTIFCVFALGSDAAGSVYNGISGQPNRLDIQGTPNHTASVAAGTSGPQPATATGTVAPGRFHISAVVYNGAASSIQIDTKTPILTTVGVTDSTSTLLGLRLSGNTGGSSSYFDGDIAEVMVFHRALAANEINAVIDRLSLKYGVLVAP